MRLKLRWALAAAAAVCSFVIAFLWYRDSLPGKVLTNVDAVLRLSHRERRQGYPVRIKGAITSAEPDNFVLNDGSGGLRFEFPAGSIVPGTQTYEASGITDTDGVNVLIVATELKSSTKVPTWPRAKSASISEVLSGKLDNQYVMLSGTIIRRAENGRSDSGLELESQGLRLSLDLEDGVAESVGMAVSVLGTVGSRYSATGEVVRTQLWTHAIDVVADGGRAAATHFPVLTSIEQIKGMERTTSTPYPAHVQGVVTYVNYARYLLFVQNSTGAIYCSPPENRPIVKAGDLVDIKGTRGAGLFAPTIEHTGLTVLGRGSMPAPEKLTNAIVSGRLDSRWVEVEGRIHSVGTRSGLSILEIVADHERISVVLPLRPDGTSPSPWLIRRFEFAGSMA